MFFGCTMLKNVSLPATVTVIGSTAFSNASNLTGVYYHGTVEPTTYNPGLNNASFSLTPDTMVIYASNDYSGTTMGLNAKWENDVHNVTKIDGYFVNVAHTIGGAVKVDKSIVPVGDTVTVDTMAYKNYALDTFTVTDADGNEITASGDENTRTFAMPAGDVTIIATFKSTIVPHVHSWTFEAEGTYINATCSNIDGACHNPYQSVVMTPPSLTYFAWSLERTVKVSGTIEDVEIPEVVYTLKSTGEEVRPFAPGVYVASLTIENTTLTYEYEITKSNQLNYSFFTYTAPANLTYDGTAKIATVVPNATADAYIGEVEVLYGGNSTPPTDVGSYVVTINVAETDYYSAKTNLSLGGRGGQKFSIVAKDVGDLTYVLEDSYLLNGGAATPDVTIQYNGMTLEKDTDYTIEYANNTEPGTATMTITGIGNYTGTKTLEFNVIESNQSEITNVNMTVGTDLSYNVYADLSDADGESEMRFTVEGEEITVSGVYDENAGLYRYTLAHIPPQGMLTEIKAELVKDGEVLDTHVGTIRGYLGSLVELYPEDAELKQLVADMLGYGAAAQIYVGYNTDNLANAGVTGESEFVALGEENYIAKSEKGTEVDGVKFIGIGVRFDYVNKVFFRFTAPSLEGVAVTVNGEKAEIEAYGEGYIVYSDAINATEFANEIVAVLTSGDTEVQTVTYSVESFVYEMQNAEDSTAELAKALYNYGLSAIAYAAK